MTDHENKPSFLARFAIIATVGVVVFQVFMGADLAYRKADGYVGKFREEYLWINLLVASLYLAIAGLYYLFKGKPENADQHVASRLYAAWPLSVFWGVVFAVLYF